MKYLQKLIKYQRTVKELESLTDRDLNDLGISRCDIRRIAWMEVA